MELLERHFDTAFDAPDGIKRLRELILTLAMQGKLVQQNPVDSPASELLKKIETEKKRLVKQGKMKEPKPLPPVSAEEAPYTLPNGWEWARLGSIGIINPRNDMVDDSIAAGFIPMALIEDGYSGQHTFETREWREIKKGFTHFANGDIGMAKITPCFENAKSCVFKGLPNGIGAGTTELHVFRDPFGSVVPEFLLYYLKNPAFISASALKMTGSAGQKRVPTVLFAEGPFPLPPLKEQTRIVAKIDELMARCDALEKLRAERDGKRLAVHTAAVRQLMNVADTCGHIQAREFLGQHFGELYTVKENVTELRKAILQLAVMGKLVPQDPNDPPASELLKQIEGDKKRLVMEGKLREPKPLPPVATDEMPYDVPLGWTWARFGLLAQFINGDRGKNYPNRDEYVSHGVPWINTGHIEPDGTLTKHEMYYITREKFNNLNGGKIQPGDLVYCLRGATFGKTAIVDPYAEGGIASSLMIVRPFQPLSNRYMYYYLIGPIGRQQILRFDNGSAQPNLSANSVKFYVYPLPPIAEQRRIVAKIDQLMTLCDNLEQEIDAARGTQSDLLNAVMAQYGGQRCA